MILIWHWLSPVDIVILSHAAEGIDPAAWLVLGARALMLAVVIGFGAGSLWLALNLPRSQTYQVDAGSALRADPAGRGGLARAATTTSRSRAVDRSRLVAGSLSIGTAMVHGLVIPEHFEEWWGYGVFFVVASLLQGLYGLVLMDILRIPDPWWRLDWFTQGSDGNTKGFYSLGALGNVAVIVLYVVTRTVGIPWFGPEAGTVEAVTALSLASKLIEGALVVVLWRLRSQTNDG